MRWYLVESLHSAIGVIIRLADFFFLLFQPVIRLYAVPLTAFSVEEDDDGEGFEGEEHEFTS